jgi:type VI secretion system secreted protein VgrG
MLELPTVALMKLSGSALPKDSHVVSFSAQEALSKPYCVVVQFETNLKDLDMSAALRTRALLFLMDEKRHFRHFDGFVERARFVGIRREKLTFEIELRPSLYALTHRADHRVFQKKSIPDIVKLIFEEANITPVEWKLDRTHGIRELIVQYGESTLDFVSRLLEEAGIFYYFLHTTEGHQLKLCDTVDGFGHSVLPPKLSLSTRQGDWTQPLTDFSRRRTLSTTDVQLRDYDFEKPDIYPEGNASAKDNWPSPYYEYPARTTVASELDDTAKVRLAERRAKADVCNGRSHAIGLEVGRGFSVVGSQHDELDGDYIVTSLSTSGSGRSPKGEAHFLCANQFRGILKGASYAPQRVTPKPKIPGHQTAFVTGDDKADQAILTDEFGRIKVRFHWDRVSQRDANSSPWVRVSQVLLGGTMVIPRIGWEVTVAFLEGDPDRPLVLGRTYNAEAAPPLSLPAGKASSSLESMSSPGGAGSNKILMGDSGGSQGFGISAQKDLNITTGNNCNVTIGVDDSHEISANYSRTVKVDETLTVSGNQEVSVGANLSVKVGGSQTIEIGGDDTTNSTANHLEKITGDRSYTIESTSILINNTIERQVTGDFTREAGTVQILVAADSISDNVMVGTTSEVGAVRVHVVGGSHGETVGGAKSEMEAAAAVHLTSTDYATEAGGTLAYTVGGVHLRKITEDYVVKAPVIALVGGVGQLKVGSSKISLNGGPLTMKASKVIVQAALIQRTGGSLKFA